VTLTTPAGFSVTDLTVTTDTHTLVSGLSCTITPGEMVAIIGESGSGKTMTARALTGLLPRGVKASGTAVIDDYSYDLADSPESVWREVRGRRAALLLQDPFTSLSPVIRSGRQIEFTITARAKALGETMTQRDIADEVHSRLDEVNLPARVAAMYPSELSGGMRQRVAIAAALAASPRLLIADEPTTALDASTQGEVLDLLKSLQIQHQMSLLLISHDLGIVSGRADTVMVMRHGEVVEEGPTSRIIASPSHPYTRALIDANPSIDSIQPPAAVVTDPPLLVASNVSKSFGSQQVLHQVSLEVRAGEILAIVGESGSGKSTLARAIAGLDVPDTGTVSLAGATLPAGRKGRHPSQMQIVFQDPYQTLNPSFTIRQTLEEARRAGGNRAPSVDELLARVELDLSLDSKRPSQLSGGQRQRVAIARALAPEPQVLMCDESVSALDVSVQAHILDLLERLREELGLGMLFITHDLGVVARIASRVIVLQKGTIVEEGPTNQILGHPTHDYTRMLVSAARHDSITSPAKPASTKNTSGATP
jgi:peptide/nickel transport system ATP-binding protein